LVERSEKGRVRSMEQSYLDLALLINGGMDAFLLVLTGRILHWPRQARRILGGVAAGELPVLLSFWNTSWLLRISVLGAPVLMVWLAFRPRSTAQLGKGLAAFWLLSAGVGGLVYALANWMAYAGPGGSQALTLGLTNFWLLPVTAGAWWLGNKAWERLADRKVLWQQGLYDLAIDFGAEGKSVRVKALLDTGNQLQDPLTGAPVVLLEEAAAREALPAHLKAALDLPWREQSDPWPLLWQEDPVILKTCVFIPYRAIGRRSWLFGIRPERLAVRGKESFWSGRATVALVDQMLSSDGVYKALVHPGLIGREGTQDEAVAVGSQQL